MVYELVRSELLLNLTAVLELSTLDDTRVEEELRKIELEVTIVLGRRMHVRLACFRTAWAARGSVRKETKPPRGPGSRECTA
jgi:hypothetical protein